MIKRHPTDGAALLGHIGGFDEELPLVRGHHERLDGSGYPDGLRGNELSLEVRILGVCDVYDALTSERVYRRAFSQAQALTILDQGRDIAFDPDVLDALSRVVGEAPAVRHLRAACRQNSPAGAARASSVAIASGIDVPVDTLQTASVIGRSTPASRASAARAGAVCSPSTTMPTSPLGVLGRDAAREQLAGGVVARVPRRAGRDEVAETGEARRRCAGRRRAPSRAGSSRPVRA